MEWLSLAISLIIIGYGLYVLMKNKVNIYAFGFLIFIVGLIPALVSSFTYTKVVKTAMIEPHWFAFSSIGFFLLTANLIGGLKKYANAKFINAFIIIILLCLGVATHRGNKHWKNPETYSHYWLNINSLNGTGWHCKARSFLRRNDKGLDPSHYENCYQPAYLAFSYHITEDASKASFYYKTALDINPDCDAAFWGLALLYQNMGLTEQANLLKSKGKAANPKYEPLYNTLIKAFEYNSDRHTARKIYKLMESLQRN